MNDDIFQPVLQGSFGAQDAENRRIEAVADELRRCCKLYEAQRGDSQPHVSPLEVESRAAEAFAKEHGLWLPMTQVFDLGTQLSSSGNLEKKSLSSIFIGFAAKVLVLSHIYAILTFLSPFITTRNFNFRV